MKATKTNMPIKTLQVRVRDRHAALLSRMAFEVNQVWNLANEASYEAWHVPVPEVGYIQGVWRSAFDIQKDILPIRKARGFILPSHTVQQVVAEHAARRRQFKTSKLRWRASSGSRRALGWIPFKKGSAKWVNGQVRFAGHYFRVWDSYDLADYEFRAGSFVQDARGRWYFSVSVEYQPNATPSRKAVGVDLGLKDTATCSDGTKLEAGRFYRGLEDALGKAQRANKPHRVQAIHAKIRNRRKDAIHKFTTHLAERYGVIFVGDVSSAKLVKTKMAKSVLDAGWHQLKTQLKYKAIARSGVFEEVNEAYSTQVCSCCGAKPDSSPKGRAGLGIRHWICSECGAEHDRDINAAKNILAAGGHPRLDGGILALQGE
ncbi:RNA-guided endonuclease InsQ/TnpB family protein [Thiolapillus sp.]|uniref:RNA-guided endonuclease InsQ/TnpB family protein n=16 Tax=Thiolapillus sp. TaxID=2017437 RepID=UPI003AF48752